MTLNPQRPAIWAAAINCTRGGETGSQEDALESELTRLEDGLG